MDEDISKKSVAILLILVTALSVIGTFAVMNEIQKIRIDSQIQEISKPATAEVRINILNPVPPEKQVSTATGRVTINIMPNENTGG